MFESLALKSFRNIDALNIELSNSLNVFVGENGQGKSNLLEALSLLSQGDSFRPFENQFLIKSGTNASFLKAITKKNQLRNELECKIEGNLKFHFLNQKKTNSAYLKKNFLNVIFSPESLEVIKDSSEKRRLLIDDLIVSLNPVKSDLLTEYRKQLRVRNRILKDLKDRKNDFKTSMDLLEAVDPLYLKSAVEVTWLRLQALLEIVPPLNKVAREIIRTENVDISVEYVASKQNLIGKTHDFVDDCLKKRAAELRNSEIASGTSLVGPHRHDIMFLYNRNDSRFFCSQGQQRALILAFKMAQIVYHRQVHGVYPVLMLDDVLSELDSDKRNSLIAFLSGLNTQIFLTTTDFQLPPAFGNRDCFVMKVREGKIV